MEKVGIIGLGVLGSAIAPLLVASGFRVTGYDVEPAKLKAMAERGIEPANSPQTVADAGETVITCLPTPESLMRVVAGPRGLDAGSREGQIVIETSTFDIADKERARDHLAAAGKVMLDCPVSGNRIMAMERKLTAFASGDRAAFEAVEQVISGFVGRTHYVGPFGHGMKMKMCGNILNLVHNAVAAEVMVLGMKAGLDPQLIHQVISGSGSSSRMFEVRGALMARNDYDHEGMNFSIPLKDSRIISAHAANLAVPTPIYQAALQSYYAAVAQGHHDEDQSAVCAAMERAANCQRGKPVREN